jgi:glycosyltransferase involved in cell wall biosynthesis
VIAKLRKKKVFIDFDDLDSEWQSTPLRKRLMQLTERWMPKYADLVTTHNRYLQQFIRDTGAENVSIIPQGVDTELFDPRKYDKHREKERLGLENHRVLSFLGSFTVGSSRDLHIILKATAEVQQREKNVSLLIIGGEGPLERKYLEMIKALGLKNVHITGRMSQQEVPRHLAASDLGLIAMQENRANRMRVSLKMLEYLAMELTVVGHMTGESRDVLGRYCHLCEPSARSLAERINEVFNTSNQKESARQFIAQHYDWKVISQSVSELLGSFIK